MVRVITRVRIVWPAPRRINGPRIGPYRRLVTNCLVATGGQRNTWHMLPSVCRMLIRYSDACGKAKPHYHILFRCCNREGKSCWVCTRSKSYQVYRREAEWLRASHLDWSSSTSTESPEWWICCGRWAAPSVSSWPPASATPWHADSPRAWTICVPSARKTRHPPCRPLPSLTTSSEPYSIISQIGFQNMYHQILLTIMSY